MGERWPCKPEVRVRFPSSPLSKGEQMKLLIAGSRSITDYEKVKDTIENFVDIEEFLSRSGRKIDKVITGGAIGVDQLGARWAREKGIPVLICKPNWKRDGKRAGFIRNSLMIAMLDKKEGDMLLAIWDGKSRGTNDTIEKAKKEGVGISITKI